MTETITPEMFLEIVLKALGKPFVQVLIAGILFGIVIVFIWLRMREE